MFVIKKRKRVMAVGCSHGNRANKDALAAALLFREQFNPDEVIHLGDAYDLASLRAGSLSNPDDSDHADDYLDDVDKGQEFLDALRPTVFIVGNHDQRAVKYMHHHNTVVRGFAEAIWAKMIEPIEKHARVFIKTHDVLPRSWYRLGGFSWGHGILYGENFLRDTAETWGNTVVAHAHRAGVATGRRNDNPICLSPGTLSDVGCMDYALRRRGTMAWSHGIVFGEYTEDQAKLYVHQWPQGEKTWTLPSF